jgi:uncharacterized phage protein (TIGR01671 family)
MKSFKLRAGRLEFGVGEVVKLDYFTDTISVVKGPGQPVYAFGFDRVEILPFTGLKDKDGKDIYEGDILSFFVNTKYGRFQKRGVVRVDTIAGGASIMDLPHELDGMPLDFLALYPEVIGNIYENPELLK